MRLLDVDERKLVSPWIRSCREPTGSSLREINHKHNVNAFFCLFLGNVCFEAVVAETGKIPNGTRWFYGWCKKPGALFFVVNKMKKTVDVDKEELIVCAAAGNWLLDHHHFLFRRFSAVASKVCWLPKSPNCCSRPSPKSPWLAPHPSPCRLS